MKRVTVDGGPATTLCSLSLEFAGGSWSPDGRVIAFSAGFDSQIFQIPAQGGEPKELFTRERTEKGSVNLNPVFLPGEAGARAVLFPVGGIFAPDIAVKNLETGEFTLLAAGAKPFYSPTGHVLYQNQGRLWALPFSVETLKPTGESFVIAENAGDASASGDGTLVYVDSLESGQRQLVWLDRAGRKVGEIGQPQYGINHPTLSPDGRFVAVQASEGGNADIWVHETDRALKRRVTFDPGPDAFPRWSPSGKEIVFSSNRAGNPDVFTRPADGSGEATRLVGSEDAEFSSTWSPDGKYFLYVVTDRQTADTNIWYIEHNDQEGGVEARPFLQTPFLESTPRLSPAGDFVVYMSAESDRNEIYVRPFPEGEGKWQISANGGVNARWSGNGKEVFYVQGDTLMAVEVSTEGGFSAGSAKPLFRHPGLVGSTSTTYDVSADGQRFVVVENLDPELDKPLSIHVVENWYEEFRDREQ